MTTDIVQALKIRAVSAASKHHEYTEVPVLLLSDAAAEIVRLLGEVEAWSKSYDRAVELGQQHRVRAELMEAALLGFPEEPNPYTYRIAYAKARATIAGAGITEQQKADRDLLLYGASFICDGTRIDPSSVSIAPAEAKGHG